MTSQTVKRELSLNTSPDNYERVLYRTM